MAYAVATALFVAAIVLSLRLRQPEIARKHYNSSLSSLLSGIHFVWRRKVVLGAMTLDVFAVLFGSAVALLPIYAKDILHVGPDDLGWLRAGPAIGAFSMALYLVHHPMKSRIGRTLLICVGLYGLATIVFGVSTSFMLSMEALIMTCACDMVSVVIRQTLVQLETPDDMRGRVSAVNSVFIGASNQLGEFESGAAAALIGPVGAAALGGAATCLLALMWPKLFPDLARRARFEK